MELTLEWGVKEWAMEGGWQATERFPPRLLFQEGHL